MKMEDIKRLKHKDKWYIVINVYIFFFYFIYYFFTLYILSLFRLFL